MKLLRRLPSSGLPLLVKELHEQSARPRTFVLRVAYAILLIFMVVMVNWNRLFDLGQGGGAFGSKLGGGGQLFETIVQLQFGGIYLFLPAIVCGVLTVEKERNTLGLLLITKLGGWTIIFEKFASRIVPMLTFLLISLPLISFTYSLGGMESQTLFLGLWFLLLLIFQIGSIGILASSFFSGTVGAFFGTYFLVGAFLIGPGLVSMLLPEQVFQMFISNMNNGLVYLMTGRTMNESYFFGMLSLWVFSPIALLSYCIHLNDYRFSTTGFSISSYPYTIAFVLSLPTLVSIVISLALARFFLIRRAFITTTNPILSLFKWMDWIFAVTNKRFAAGVVLVKESQTMPDLEPVAWRETAKRSMGQFRYLVRIFLTLQFPTSFLLFLVATGSRGDQARSEPVSGMLFLVWTISAVLIAVTASNLIAAERSRQTLDVLLSTPINGRDLILQKLRGVQRLMLVLAIPLLTCIGFQTWWKPQVMTPLPYNLSGPESRFDQLEYVVTSIAGVIILFHLIMWVAFWIGLRMTSPSKAILSTLGILVACCAVPSILTLMIAAWLYSGPHTAGLERGSSMILWMLDSPAFLIYYCELYPLRWLTPVPYLPVILNSVIYGGLWFGIRYFVLSNADRNLNRINSGTDSRRMLTVPQELTSLIEIRS